MRNSRYLKVALLLVSVIIAIALVPSLIHAQAIKTTCSEIVANPNKYDGKMVQVDGVVEELFFKVSKKGNPYYTFKLVDSKGKSVNVFNFGKPTIKDGGRVITTGRYEIERRVTSSFTVHNQIDASKGGVALR